MIHPLDPLKPLKHADGTDYSEDERYAFFEDAEERIRNRHANDRANHYNAVLSIGQQLDMLWHEVRTNGTISANGAWFNAIQEVKDNFPKGDDAYNDAVAQVAQMRQNQE